MLADWILLSKKTQMDVIVYLTSNLGFFQILWHSQNILTLGTKDRHLQKRKGTKKQVIEFVN